MRSVSIDGVSGQVWLSQALSGTLAPEFEVRLIRFNGDRTSESGWTVNTLPRGAMYHRVRDTDLEKGTWELDLEINPDVLPSGVTVKQYDGIEIDIVYGNGAGRWGYFSGLIDHEPKSWQNRGGVPVRGQMIKAFGVMQYCKGLHVTSLVSSPWAPTATEKLMALCSLVKAKVATTAAAPLTTTTQVDPLGTEVTVSSSPSNFTAGQPIIFKNGGTYQATRITAVDAATSKIYFTPLAGTSSFAVGSQVLWAEDLPMAAVTYNLAGELYVSPNPDYSSRYLENVEYLIDYGITLGNHSVTIGWVNTPANPRYFRYPKVDRWVAPRVSLYVNVTAGGAGYTSAPVVNFSGGGGSGASAIAEISGGAVVGVIVTWQGKGYTSAPTCTLSGGGGAGATVSVEIRPSFYVLSNPGSYDPSLGTVNAGREFTDLYHTTAEAVAGNVITPRDLAPFTTAGLFLYNSQPEYVILQPSEGDYAGTEVVRKISSINVGTGAITLDYLSSGFVAGDKFRVATSEHWQAWDDTTEIKFYSDSALTTEYKRRWFKPLPSVGQVLQTKGKAWLPSENVYATNVGPVKDPHNDYIDPYYLTFSNRVEHLVHALITDANVGGLGIYKAGTDIASGQVRLPARTGAVRKNYNTFGRPLEEVLDDLMQAMPANVYMHDHPGDGGASMGLHGYVTIKPYSQADEPDAQLIGVREVTEDAAPEPYNSTLVIAEGEPVNLAGSLVQVIANCRLPSALYDGSRDTDCHASDPKAAMKVALRIPRITPKELFPLLDKVVVVGRGLLTVYVTDGLSTYYSPTLKGRPFGRPAGVVGPYALTAPAGAAATTLTLGSVDNITPGMVGTLIERSGGGTPGSRTTVVVREVNPVTKVVTLCDAVGGAYTYSTNATVEFANVASEAVELSREELAGLLGHLAYSTKQTDVVCQVEYNTDIAGPALSEIEAPCSIHGAWRADFTDDTTKTDANNGVNANGTVWKQWDPRQRVSARYIEPSLLKATMPRYNTSASKAHRYRLQKIRQKGFSSQDARDVAERFQDEAFRLRITRSVEAELDPRLELGDTVAYVEPDGTARIEMLTGQRDSGGPMDFGCVYRTRDYSLSA